MSYSATSPNSPGTYFHKHLDLAKATTSTFENHRLSTAANSIHKVPSVTTIRSSRLFAKGSLFNSFVSTEGRRTKSVAFKKVPRVEIQNIIKGHADKYYDESLTKSVD